MNNQINTTENNNDNTINNQNDNTINNQDNNTTENQNDKLYQIVNNLNEKLKTETLKSEHIINKINQLNKILKTDRPNSEHIINKIKKLQQIHKNTTTRISRIFYLINTNENKLVEYFNESYKNSKFEQSISLLYIYEVINKGDYNYNTEEEGKKQFKKCLEQVKDKIKIKNTNYSCNQELQIIDRLEYCYDQYIKYGTLDKFIDKFLINNMCKRHMSAYNDIINALQKFQKSI